MADLLPHTVTGTGPPLLLVAGTGLPGATWTTEIVRPLSTRHTVVTFDLPGTGRAVGYEAECSTRGFAAAALELLAHLGLGPVHVLGHSFGGRVAQWIALDGPDQVSSLILAASGPGRDPAQAPDNAQVEASRRRIRAVGFATYMHRFLGRGFFTERFAAEHPEVPERLFGLFWRDRPTEEAFLAHVAARQAHSTVAFLPSLRVPTLVFVGDEDRTGMSGSHLEQSERLAMLIPRAQFVTLPGLKHGLLWENPQACADLVTRWCGRGC